MASEQGKRFLDNEGFKQALVGLATMAVTGGKGYPGLVRMQDKMKAAQEKLQEKMERRMEKLQTVLMQRSAAMAKVPTYTGEMATLSARLGSSDEAKVFMEAMYNDPSKAKDVLKYVRDVEKETGLELTSGGVLDAITVLATQDAEIIDGFRSSADIMESVKGQKILDNETYYQALSDAMVIQPTTGFTALKYSPVPTVQTDVMKRQDDYLLNQFGDYIRADIMRTGEDKYQTYLNTMDELGGLTPKIREVYGRKFMEGIIQNKDNPLFRNAIRMNPQYQNLFKAVFPDVINQFYADYDNRGVEAINQFDAGFGFGVGQSLIDTRIN